MGAYGVKIVGDDELPEGHDWAMVEHGEARTFYVKRRALNHETLAKAPAAMRELVALGPPVRQL